MGGECHVFIVASAFFVLTPPSSPFTPIEAVSRVVLTLPYLTLPRSPMTTTTTTTFYLLYFRPSSELACQALTCPEMPLPTLISCVMYSIMPCVFIANDAMHLPIFLSPSPSATSLRSSFAPHPLSVSCFLLVFCVRCPPRPDLQRQRQRQRPPHIPAFMPPLPPGSTRGAEGGSERSLAEVSNAVCE